jgi:hypothetical protein
MMMVMIKGTVGYFGFKLAALAPDTVRAMNTAHYSPCPPRSSSERSKSIYQTIRRHIP